MANTIVEISETEYTVNNKRCILDINDNWINPNKDMTSSKVAAIQRHLLKLNKLLVNT